MSAETKGAARWALLVQLTIAIGARFDGDARYGLNDECRRTGFAQVRLNATGVNGI